MTEFRSKSLADAFKKYLFEVAAIFLGISISFWFDEWRDNRKDRETEREILQNLRENLVQDTFMLSGTIGMFRIEHIENLVTTKNNPAILDSINIFIDAAASYLGFLPNQTAYEEIKQSGKTFLIQNDTLRKEILRHYTVLIPFVQEWCESDKTHIMTQLIPEMSNYFPIVVDTLGWVTPAQKVKFLKTPKIKYLLLTSVEYKKEAIKTLKIANRNTKRLIASIDKALIKH